jgi:hypothetical protein
MRKLLTFNLADREKYRDSLIQLHGGNHEATEARITLADSDSERVSRMQSVLGIRATDPVAKRIPDKTRERT